MFDQKLLLKSCVDYYIDLQIALNLNSLIYLVESPQHFFRKKKGYKQLFVYGEIKSEKLLDEDLYKKIIYNFGNTSQYISTLPIVDLFFAILKNDLEEEAIFNSIKKFSKSEQADLFFIYLCKKTHFTSPLFYDDFSLMYHILSNDKEHFYGKNILLLYCIKKNDSRMLDVVNDLIAIDSGNEFLLMHKARIYGIYYYKKHYNRKYLIKALAIVKKAFEIKHISKTVPPAYFFTWRGFLYEQIGIYKKASKDMLFSIMLSHSKGFCSGEVYLSLIRVYLKCNKYQKSYQYLIKLKILDILFFDKYLKYDRGFLSKNSRYYFLESLVYYYTRSILDFSASYEKAFFTYLSQKKFAWNNNCFQFIFKGNRVLFRGLGNILDSEREMVEKFSLIYENEDFDRIHDIFFIAYVYLMYLLGEDILFVNNQGIERGSIIFFINYYKKIKEFKVLDQILKGEKNSRVDFKRELSIILETTPFYKIVDNYDK